MWEMVLGRVKTACALQQKGLQNQVVIPELALIQHSTSSSPRKVAAAGLKDKFYLPVVLELWTRFLLRVKANTWGIYMHYSEGLHSSLFLYLSRRVFTVSPSNFYANLSVKGRRGSLFKTFARAFMHPVYHSNLWKEHLLLQLFWNQIAPNQAATTTLCGHFLFLSSCCNTGENQVSSGVMLLHSWSIPMFLISVWLLVPGNTIRL